ncbi:hypothetical protein [Streptomyces sp. NPDC002644]
MEKTTERLPERRDEGCLVAAVRLPVRIVALVVVLPLRMLWDLVVATGRLLWTAVLGPAWRGLDRTARWLGRVLVLTPARWVYRWLLAPAGRAAAFVVRGLGWLLWQTGRGIAFTGVWLARWLVAAPAEALYRWVLAPLGHAAASAGRWLWRLLRQGGRGAAAAVAWLVRVLVVVPAVWLYRWVLTPLGHGLTWLVRWLVVAPAVALYRWVLTPLGHGVAWCARGVAWCARGVAAVTLWLARWLVIAPLRAVGRVLAVVLREVGEALGHAWRIAGRISLAAGRLLLRLLRWILVDPVRWVFRAVLAPAGRLVRDTVLRPLGRTVRAAGGGVRNAVAAARVTVRELRREVRTALFGSPRKAPAAPLPRDRREPAGPGARTLGSSTTALTKD